MLRAVSRSTTGWRRFSLHSSLLNAQVFKMPAMSPTMTEGGIVSWKFKAGDEFASGDVLLEVETDKATIDVEAQDDGIMWEVLEQDGTSGIPVGKPIALLAEPGDNLSELKRPDLSAAEPAKQAKEEEPKEPKEPKDSKDPKKSKQAKDVSKEEDQKKNTKSQSNASHEFSLTRANKDKLLTPAVQFLLHSNNISDEEAYNKIPASGPQGRILKGDVLAHLGRIEASAITKVASYIKSKEHLDLSNIKLAAPKPAVVEEPASKAEKPKPTNAVSMELVMDVEEDITKNEFKHVFLAALDDAKREAYRARFPNYAQSPTSSGLYASDIFDDLLDAPVTKDRLDILKVDFKFSSQIRPFREQADVFDDLLGVSTPQPAALPSAEKAETKVAVTIDLKYDDKLADAQAFLSRFQDVLREEFPWKQVVIRQ